MIAIGNFRYLQTGALSFLTITCKMKSQKHASRFDLRYDTYSGLWCHKPMKELGFECDFVKLDRVALYGSVDLTKDRAGLRRARELRALLEAVVSALEREGKALP